MNILTRVFAAIPETIFYGTSYAAIKFLIRSPKPLDPDETWEFINRELPAPADWIRRHYPPEFARGLLLSAKLKQDHLLGIAEHYDVSNDFYAQFLDQKYMFYTCADHHTPNDSLEQAQTNKANFLLNLIDPKSGERILDLGCGWGAMLQRIYEKTGDKANLYGYTLSQEQVAYNDEHNGFNVEFKNFITCDYEDAYFDKIFSIGSWEHVRSDDVPVLLKKLHSALKPNGRLVKHFFCPPTDRLSSEVMVPQIFFPGSMPPGYITQVRAFEEAGFRITHRSIHDYRQTLRDWFENLVSNKEKAIDLVGIPTYNRYLVFFCSAFRSFEEGQVMLVRYVLEKQPNDESKIFLHEKRARARVSV